ncbi:MAG: hypothetical protein E7585_06240 [Ruminococcaceae bacterium]|nr:hypothetical protein [Oscillospiraceae bacterium]
MTSLEFIMPFFVGFTAIFGVVLAILCSRAERQLRERKNINLANYKAQSHLFYVLNDLPIGVLAGIGAGLSVVSGFICLFSAVIRMYAITAFLVAAVEGVVLYLSLTRKKCGRDIRAFDSYYVQVENVLARKERTLANISVCQQRVDVLRERLTRTIREFNQNLAKGLSDQFVSTLFAPIDSMISEYVKEIHAFSEQVERNFDVALQEFLYNKVEPEFHAVPLRSFDETAVDELLTSIKASYGDEIAAMVVEQVQAGAVKNAKSLGNIMTLLHGLEVVMDNETLVRFLSAASSFEDREALAVLLYRNRQIPANTVRETFVAQNWEWIFVPAMAAAYNRRELTAILTDVLRADRAAMCYRLLSGFDAFALDVLDAALQDAKTENSATKVAAAYRLILSKSYAVGNSGNAFENLGYMLYDRMEELDFSAAEKTQIADIVRSESYYWARRELATFYARALQSGAPMVASATRVLLQYIVDGQKDFLDAARLATVLGEYKETLSFRDIATMRTLLAGWLLMTSENVDVLRAVLLEMSQLPVQGVATGDPTIENSRHFGKALVSHLVANDRARLRSLIYRTESARQMLDRIVRL